MKMTFFSFNFYIRLKLISAPLLLCMSVQNFPIYASLPIILDFGLFFGDNQFMGYIPHSWKIQLRTMLLLRKACQ